MKTLKKFGPGQNRALRLTLGDTNPDVANELAVSFNEVDEAKVIVGNLLDVRSDAIVCPGNSFGDMGGGFDKAIDDLHNGEAQEVVRAAIAREYFGELPVGAAMVVSLRAPQRAPHLVIAPTMRVPGNVGDSIGAYLAMRAALVAIYRYNSTADRQIATVSVPGMCTGVGGMEFAEAAEQMRVAFDNVVTGRWRRVVHPALAPYALRE